MRRTDLSHWAKWWRELGAQGDPGPWHQRVLTAYGGSGRHYHTLEHLEHCLAELEMCRTLVREPAVVEAAFWFHDAVYDPRSTTNEEDSATLAVACLDGARVNPATIETVRRLVLSTKTHEPGGLPDAALLIDIDLAILGQPADRFWKYEHAIRAEYAWVPAVTFGEKRAEILERFLRRPAIYRTEAFRVRYEFAARANLAAAITRLRASSP